MTRSRAVAALLVLSLVVAVGIAWCGGDGSLAVEAESKFAPAPRSLRLVPEAPEKTAHPAAGMEEPGGEEPHLVRAGKPGDAAVDGGSLDDFIDTMGKRAVSQFLADNAAAAEKHIDRYCAETRDLVSRKELVDPPRMRDAAGYMAGRSDWEGGVIGLLHLPDSITERMGNPPGAWRRAGPDLYAGLDFSWMTELLQFDHWSLLGAGPLRDKQVNFYEEILPNYVTLMAWSKLRLIKGMHEGNLAQASLEVRHLADLIRSSGSLIGEMIRVALYSIERKTWEDLGQPAPEGLPTADEGWRLRHSAFAGIYLLYPGVSRAVKEKALKCVPMRCAALIEAIGAAASVRQLVPDVQPDIEWLQAQGPCDRELAARAARSPPISREVLKMNFMGEASLLNSLQSMTDGGW